MEDQVDFPEPPGVTEGMTHEEREEEFIRRLAAGYTVRDAAASVAISYTAMYRKRRSDPVFAQAWQDALRVTVKELETEGLRRAMRGSDRLLMFMLRAKDPATYGERQEVTHKGGMALNVITGMPASPVDDLL